MMSAKFPPPTVCTHPRIFWMAEGTGQWPPGPDGSTGVIYGYRCRCGAWISKQAADDEVMARLREHYDRFSETFERLRDA